jgi:hypothetical protein
VKIESINQTATKIKSILTIDNVCEGCVFGRYKTVAIHVTCRANNTNGISDRIKFKVNVDSEYIVIIIYISLVYFDS